VYATVADYVAYTAGSGVAVNQPRVGFLLPRASLVLDDALIGARYAVDPQGYPTDATLIDSLNKAVCEQVMFMLDMDDDTGVKARMDQVSVGGLSFHRTAGTAGLAKIPLAPMAKTFLHQCGALPSAPLTNY
jgi:hypothetical protein